MPTAPWTTTELATLDLGDPRRDRRCAQLLASLANQPHASLPRACGAWPATKAAYRFLAADSSDPAAIQAAHADATVARIAARPADAPTLLVQDTTTLDFSHQPSLQAAGPIGRSRQQTGLLVHSTLAVDAAGVPLGLLDQRTWTRDPAVHGQRTTRRQRPTAAKESQRWLDALQASTARLPADQPTITVADREADLWALFAAPRPAGAELLIRAAHNRRVSAGSAAYLWPAAAAAPQLGTVTVNVHARPDRPARDACLTVQATPLTLEPPRNGVQPAAAAGVPVWSVLAEEPAPPPDTTPLRWLLLVTWPVTTLAGAEQCLTWYSRRWLSERFHFVLKSGCRIESRQLEQVVRLERLLALLSMVAWRLLWLTHQARCDDQQPCTVALRAAEWQTLWLTQQPGQALPIEPPRLAQVVAWIGRLGGHLGRRGDGPPGVKTLWQGWQRLQDLTVGYVLAQTHATTAADTCG